MAILIRCFLTGRTQQVHLHGMISSIQPLGVPQSSVISPTLFNVHINDLGYLENTVPNLVNISTCKYADDCTQYQIVIERGMCSPMQEAVDGLSGSINKMTLNPKKQQRIYMWICFTDSILEPLCVQIND